MARPKQALCKRGHDRRGVDGCCVQCRRLMARMRYASDTAWREQKKEKVRAYKHEFRQQNGYWQAELYRK